MKSINSRTSCQNVIKNKIKVFRDAELLNIQQYIRLRRRVSSQQQRRHNPNPGNISNLISHRIKQFYFLPTKCVYVFCMVLRTNNHYFITQCFSTSGPRPATGHWHQLYWAAKGSPGICHFS